MKKFLMDTSANSIATVENLAVTISNLMKNILGPVLIVVGAAAAIYAIYLGVLYAKAEDANKRKEVQGRLIGAVIGVVIVIVGITLVYAIQWDKIVWTWLGGSEPNDLTTPTRLLPRL